MSAAVESKSKVATLKDLLDSDRFKRGLAQLLPKNLTPERMTALALSAASREPLLFQCTPASLLRSIMQIATVGLEIGSGLGEAYIVPFRNNKTGRMEATAIFGY